jgi:hypothetical protein
MVVRLLGMTKIGKFPYYVLRGEGSSAMILSMVLICADDPPPRRVLFVALFQSNYAPDVLLSAWGGGGEHIDSKCDDHDHT